MSQCVFTPERKDTEATGMNVGDATGTLTPSERVSRPLRIAMVHTADRGGGAEASTLSLHLALRQLGHESFLYVGTKYTDAPHVYEIPRHRCFPGLLRTTHFLEDRFGWQYLYHPWFRKLDRLFPTTIDVIHFQSLWGGRLGFADVGGLPGLTRRYPSLMTLRDLWMVTGHCAYPAVGCNRWKTGCGQCPDLNLAPAIHHDGTARNWRRKRTAIQSSPLRVTTVSNWLGEVVQSSPIFAGKAVHTVYNGIDETAFFPRDQAAVRATLGLPADAMIVMLAGQSVEGTSSQGNGAAAYALQALKSSERKIFLLAVGKSSSNVLQQWGREGIAVAFQSDPRQLAEYYCAADVVLVASLWETFGRIPAEAQMCGVPVAAFATGGIPEVLADGVTGILAPCPDAGALGRALQTLIDLPELRAEFGRAAAPRAKQLFSNKRVAKTYLKHYEEIIAERQTTANPLLRKSSL